MKWIALGVFAALCLASAAMYAAMPENLGDKPVIFWVTDRNPARDQQVALFHEWMAQKYPEVEVELRLDMGAGDAQKKVVQGVSGVAGDVMDIFSGSDLQYFHAVGLVTDVTDAAQARGFGVERTFSALKQDMTVVGEQGQARQYAFPCNVALRRYVANLDTLERVGMDPPPERWTLDEFEVYGREYAKKANAPGVFDDGRPKFLADELPMDTIVRSMGVDLFNETLTGPGADQPAMTPDGPAPHLALAEAMRRNYDWTFGPERFMPSSADIKALSTAGGYGGAGTAAFVRGDYVLLLAGRWHLIQLREVNRLELLGRLTAELDKHKRGLGSDLGDDLGREKLEYVISYLEGDPERKLSKAQVKEQLLKSGELTEADFARIAEVGESSALRLGSCEPPHATMSNVVIGTRQATVYSGGDNKDLTLYFLEFLASEPYNANIIDDADGLPPVPAFASGPAYLEPAVDASRGIFGVTEHGVHAAWLRDAQTIALTRSFSPFVLWTTANTEQQKLIEAVMSGVREPDEAARVAADRVRRKFAESLARLEPDDPLIEQYARWSADQKVIDGLKARGEKIPRSLIRNPFHLRFYKEIGLLAEDDVTTAR